LVVKQDLSSEDSHSIAKFGRGGKKIIYSFLVAKKNKVWATQDQHKMWKWRNGHKETKQISYQLLFHV
jgi:hypothetical protein